jgi:transcriptional regulator with XRE-family HTH domain
MSRGKMENLVRTLRMALGISQQQFAAVVGCSYGSIQNYENGRAIGPAALERMIALAAERNLLTLAGELKQQYGWPSAPSPPAEINPRKWHAMLDYILQHGNAAAIAAVQSVLVVCWEHANRDK